MVEDVRKEYNIQLGLKAGMKILSFNYSCENGAKSYCVEIRELSLECSPNFGNEIVSL